MDPDATFDREIEWLSVQHSKLEKVYTEGMKFLNENVKPLIAAAKLLELVELGSSYDKLMTSIRACKAMKTLSEDTIFDIYRAGIKVAGTKPFKNFTKENSEAFYRLKLRLIEQRLDSEPTLSRMTSSVSSLSSV